VQWHSWPNLPQGLKILRLQAWQTQELRDTRELTNGLQPYPWPQDAPHGAVSAGEGGMR
jgi:hypothetical protein